MSILLAFNSVQAVNMNSATIISGGDCGSLLQYKGTECTIYYAKYIQDGVEYPAYCLEKTKQDVDVTAPYSVSINNNISSLASNSFNIFVTLSSNSPRYFVPETKVAIETEIIIKSLTP